MSGDCEKLIDGIFNSSACWLSARKSAENIAVSSRIRLARNLAGTLFPVRAGDQELLRIRDEVFHAAQKVLGEEQFFMLKVDDLEELDREFLIERHLISRELLNPRKGAGLIVNRDQGTFLMVNEEDHLRLQVLGPGLQLKKLWTAVNCLDDKLSGELAFAFSPTFGYLTACPTNLGTGLRASVMLHLPALTLTEKIPALTRGLEKLKITIRGFYGEGSKVFGNLYQVSNQSSLGERETEIVERVHTTVQSIMEGEETERQNLLAEKQNMLLDRIGRAYGMLRYARRISGEEALSALSMVRLGMDLGVFRTLDLKTFNRLFLLVQKAHLQKLRGAVHNQEERDELRAELLREALHN